MLFFTAHGDDRFQRDLRVAIAAQRPAVLRQLLTTHGSRAFAQALADLSGVVIADALAMLPTASSHTVVDALPRAARTRMQEAQGRWSGLGATQSPRAFSPLLLIC